MEDLLPNLEQTYAMSLRVYANSLVANTALSEVVERLAKVPPTFARNGHPIYNRWWRFESRLPDKRKRVVFHKLWKNDAHVMAYWQRQSVTQGHPAQVQVRSISHIDSHVYLVTVSLTENNSEAAGDDWYHISEENALVYLRVFPQIRRVERRAEIWGSHAPSALTKGDFDQGRILSCLLNIPHSNPVALTATSNLKFARNVSGVN